MATVTTTARQTHWLLRGVAVFVGSVFLLFGGLLIATCVVRMVQGAPVAAKAGLAVQIVAIVIFAVVALFGLILLWLGLRQNGKEAPVEAAEEAQEACLVEAAALCEPSLSTRGKGLAPSSADVADRLEPSSAWMASPALMVEDVPDVHAQRAELLQRRPPGGDLGQLIARCGPEKNGQTNNYVWAAILLVSAVLCVAAPGWLIEIRPGHEKMMTAFSLGGAGVMLVFALIILWDSLFGAPQTIELYEYGLVERLGNQVRQIELAAIEHLRLQEWYEHRFADRTFNVHARVKGQRQLAFSSNLRGEAERIIEYLAAHIPETELVEFTP